MKITCQRCGKQLNDTNFYTYKDGSKCQICKPCITAHIDNFDPSTFEWILEKLDVPYIPQEWNVLRDRAFAKDPYKMNGLSVIGKYLAKMKLRQWKDYSYADSQSIQQGIDKQKLRSQEQQQQFEADLKERFQNGEISQAEYKTLVSTDTQNKQLPELQGNVVTGEIAQLPQPTSYEEAIQQMEGVTNIQKNPFQQQNFISQEQMVDLGADLSHDDKMYLALKWGRLYTPSQWVTLEKLFKEFMDSFDIQGAARIDTLKMICKTSLKMNEAIDQGDIDSYQKLSRVYDSLMKSAKFTQAQNKQKQGTSMDSISELVNFVELHTGEIPKYECHEPQDLIDKIIQDQKQYLKDLVYEDKSLAQQIERYLQDRKNADAARRERQEAQEQGLDAVELTDDDFSDFKAVHEEMEQQDALLNEEYFEAELSRMRGRDKK